MDRHPRQSRKREQQSLRVVPVVRKQQRLPTPVSPVTLEQRCIMLQPSGPDQGDKTTTATLDTTGTTTIPATSSAKTTLATVAQEASTAPASASTVMVVAASPSPSSSSSPSSFAISSSSFSASTSSSSSTSTSTHAASDLLLLARSAEDKDQQQQQQPAASTPATTAAIVGGKRPLGEESPIIILTRHQEEDDSKDGEENTKKTKNGTKLSPELPGSGATQPQKLSELPDHATSKLSIHETSPSTEQPSREKSKADGKLSVQFSVPTSPKRDEAHVMEFFQEQEKSLQQSFLSLPKNPPRKQRSPSPNIQQSIGLEHLDNLVRLMEQLTSLKDENLRLRKRCDYLESTKVLLQAKSDMSPEVGSAMLGFKTMLPKQKLRHHYRQQERITEGASLLAFVENGDGTRPRLPSSEEIEYLEIVDSSSDQRPKRKKSAVHKRSFSTGSLEVPSDILGSQDEVGPGKPMKSKHGRSIFGGKSTGSKQKSKSSKWARVKKVLTGQKLYEDLGTTIKSLKEFGRSAHIRYSTGGAHEVSHLTSRSSTSEAQLRADHSSSDVPASASKMTLPSSSSGLSSSTEPHSQEELMDEHSSDIWLGPPGWWEEYEASKESAGTSTCSDISSVIEVTTMYLGDKKDIMSSSQATTTSTTSSTTTASDRTIQEQYLKVERALARRRSSPSLNLQEVEDDESLLEELATSTEPSRFLHKSSSCKSADLDLPKEQLLFTFPTKLEAIEWKKLHKTAWGKVKDIIHTRKDSVKKKPRREKSGFAIDPEESSEMDADTFLDDQWQSEVFAEGLLSRSTPKSSPLVSRQQGHKASISESPPTGPGAVPKTSVKGSSASAGNIDVAALLAGRMSGEFSKKMQEWEEMKSRKSISRAPVEDSPAVSSISQEFPPVKAVDLKDLKGKIPCSSSEGPTPEASNTSMEVVGGPVVNVEGMQRRMTDSFSRKMQEWERMKYKSSPISGRDASPEIERKGSKGRKDERQKSKRSREEKEKEKLERQREREKQKVEREQVKLDKEKLRIEKERLRALEREAKLEKLKGRLSQSEPDPGFKNPVLSPLAEYKVTADFARKLHEWELRKGLSHDISNSIYLEAQKMSLQHYKKAQGQAEAMLAKPEQVQFSLDPEDPEEKVSPPSPLNLQPFWDSPEDTSPVEKFSETSIGDESSITGEFLTKSNIASLERANIQLLDELHKKEMEYDAVQDEVQDLNQKLERVKEDHAAEMARFHRDLMQGNFAEPVKLEMGELEGTVGDLEEKIKVMENFGQKLAYSMESAAVGKWQSIEGEENVHTQLVGLVEQMRQMLIQASVSEETSQKTSALTNFESLYSQAMTLQVQMNNLRLSHLERNREIMVIKRQLLLQEVNNLLLQADITRRETELYQFREAKNFPHLKRWKTFSGSDAHRPQAQIELPQASTSRTPKLKNIGRKSEGDANIPPLPEISPSASMTSSSSISAPASPSATATSSGTEDLMATSITSLPHSKARAVGERSTDHVEKHLLTPTIPSREKELSPEHRRTSSGTATVSSSSTATTAAAAIATAPTAQPTTQIEAVPQRPAKKSLEKQMPVEAPLTSEMPRRELRMPQKKIDHREEASRIPTTQSQTKPSQQPVLGAAGKVPTSKVETGSPTFARKGAMGPPSAPSPEQDPSARHKPETPTPTIPKQTSLEKPKLLKSAQVIDDDIFPAQSVMECTESSPLVEHSQLTREELRGAVGGLNLQPFGGAVCTLPPSSDPSRAGSRSPRSPVSKHRILRRQKEDKESKLGDYRAISPKGSPVAARGKPPLPRQSTPVRQSPSASPATTEKGPRSKSVGDVDRSPHDLLSTSSATTTTVPTTTSTGKPVQDAINQFEKRATICETEDRPLELRKTPSPTLHLPRVGLVSRVRRLKPAAELLEESQRYRSGHSIYATRIMHRYLPKEESKPDSTKTQQNKENLSGAYVQAIVQRLSRETTPVLSAGSSRTNSELSLQRKDSPRADSEFVSHIVRKLSSPSSPDSPKSVAPFKDLTNGGQVKKLTQTFNGQSEDASPDRTLSESDIGKRLGDEGTSLAQTPTATKVQHRKSCEVAMVLGLTTEHSYQILPPGKSGSAALGESVREFDSVKIRPSHKSLPHLLSGPSHQQVTFDPKATRARSGTHSEGHEIEEDLSSFASTSASSKSRGEEEGGKSSSRSKGKKSAKSSREKGDAGRFPSSLSPVRKGASRGRMGTVGVLCKQSISFDLGVSLYAQDKASQEGEEAQRSRKPRSWDPSESIAAEAAAAAAAAAAVETATTTTSSTTTTTTSAQASATTEAATASAPSPERAEGGRPLSSSSEGEVVPSSPTTEEKKKSRRFLDSSWLQKSKKFFKVSK